MADYLKLGQGVIKSLPQGKGCSKVVHLGKEGVTSLAKGIEDTSLKIAQKAQGNYGIASVQLNTTTPIKNKVANTLRTQVVPDDLYGEKLIKTLSNGKTIETVKTKDGKILTKVINPDGTWYQREKLFEESKIIDDKLIKKHISGIKDDFTHYVKTTRKDTITHSNGKKINKLTGKIYGLKPANLNTYEVPRVKLGEFEKLPEHYRFKFKESMPETASGGRVNNTDLIKEWEASPYAYDLFIPVKKTPNPISGHYIEGSTRRSHGADIISRGKYDLPFELKRNTDNPQATLLGLINN